MPPKNPWLNVNLNPKVRPSKIIAKDKDEIKVVRSLARQLAGKPDYALHLNILPEPFWGSLEEANVYILSGNPGYGKVERKYNNDPLFAQATQDNITQKNPHIVWIDPNKPIDNGGKDIPHPGHDYWLKRTRVLREAAKKDNLNICIIEYFPYHSKKISSAMKTKGKNLPSSKFVDDYIKNAIGEKWIVIARCKADWINRIPALTSKGNGKVLKTRSQQMYLTPKNLQELTDKNSLTPAMWDAFVKACQ